MAGKPNPDAVNIWGNAAVYVGKSATAPQPATIDDPLGAQWDNGGILDGDAGFTNERTWDETKHFGWGIGLYRTGTKNYEESRKFTLLEDNRTTRRIAHPGSSATQIKVPKPVSLPVCFETTNDFGHKERYFTARPSKLWIPNLDRNEADPSGKEVTATIFADGDGLLYVRQYTPVNEVQLLKTATGTLTAGAFKLGVEGDDTAILDFDATNSEVLAALEAVVGSGNVAVSGTSLVAGFTITLQGEYAGVVNELLEITITTPLVGGTISVTEVTD